MSASTVARWNAISLTRDPASLSNKRPRSDVEDDSSEDNVSLVSRTPSPQPEGDVGMKDVNLYDEHVRGAAREVITVETKIKSSNKGFALLAKMGWTEGTPLGTSGEGRVEPIPFTVKQDSSGLGKINQDFRMIETTVSQRRNLDSERMVSESEEQRRQREASVAQKVAVQTEISTVLRAFYCELCDKQFKNVAQYDEHTNSYAHHHKARMKDMNANHPMKAGGKEEAEKRKEKERKREEKEMRKLAKAAGIKISAPATLTALAPPMEGQGKVQKHGWSSVSSSPLPDTGSFLPTGGGWASASSAPSGSSSTRGWASVSTPAQPAAPRSSNWQAIPPTSAPPPPPQDVSPPALPSESAGFRSGGWSTLASTTEVPSSSTSNTRGDWSSGSSASLPPPSGPPGQPQPPLTTLPLEPPSAAPSVSPSWTRGIPATHPASVGHPPYAHPDQSRRQAQHNLPSPAPNWHERGPQGLNGHGESGGSNKPGKQPEKPDQTRGNWQQFQKMRGRK